MKDISIVSDVYWTFVLPLICLFSLATNTLNIIVFSKISRKSSNIIYKYMLANSIFDQIYLFCVSFIFIVRCGQFCEIKDTFFAKVYVHYVYMYVANSVALFSLFLEIVIVLQRFSMLNNRDFLSSVNKTFAFTALFIFCFIYHIPQLSTFEIRQTNQTLANSTFGQRVYVRENVTKNKSLFIRHLIAFQTLIRLILIIVIIVLITRLTKFLFKQYEIIQSNNLNNNQIELATPLASYSKKTQSGESGNILNECISLSL